MGRIIQTLMFIYLAMDIGISKAEKGEIKKTYKYVVLMAIYLLLYLL